MRIYSHARQPWEQREKTVDRGDVAAADLEQDAPMIMDGTWTDWDVSAIVGKAKRYVCVQVELADDADNSVSLRTNGHTNAINIGKVSCVGGEAASGDVWVFTDSNGVLEYAIPSAATTAALTVKAWKEPLV